MILSQIATVTDKERVSFADIIDFFEHHMFNRIFVARLIIRNSSSVTIRHGGIFDLR